MALQFQLVKIDTPQFAIINDGEFNNPLQIDFEINFAIDNNLSAIKNTLKVVYMNANEPVMQLVIDCCYAISPDSWKEITASDKSIVAPAGFLQHLTALTIGVTRGVLHSKTEGTNLNKFSLPLIDISEIVKNDMVISPPPTKVR